MRGKDIMWLGLVFVGWTSYWASSGVMFHRTKVARWTLFDQPENDVDDSQPGGPSPHTLQGVKSAVEARLGRCVLMSRNASTSSWGYTTLNLSSSAARGKAHRAFAFDSAYDFIPQPTLLYPHTWIRDPPPVIALVMTQDTSVQAISSTMGGKRFLFPTCSFRGACIHAHIRNSPYTHSPLTLLAD